LNVKTMLKPTKRQNVMGLVAAAGVNVAHWAESRAGQVKVPAANPAYCYEWSFIEPSKVVVLNLWYPQITERKGQVYCDLNLRAWPDELRDAGTFRPAQISAASRRANRMDEAIRYAHANHLPLRIILGDGPRQNVYDPSSQKASRMNFRLLDPEEWSVTRYDPATGECRVSRGVTPTFVDQFSMIDAPTKQHSLSGKAWERARRVRDAALARAKGICECCGKPGFQTSKGSTYLETHHVVPLSEGGSDSVLNVAAICPNDHREAHHGKRRAAIRVKLLTTLAAVYSK